MFLKTDVVIEPLIEGWYAWSHLIFPPTAALNIVNRHLEIMDSYILAPDLHANAVRNPNMRGGPFIDYTRNRVEEVVELKKQTQVNQKDLITLAGDLKMLDHILNVEAKGQSLESLYKKIPVALQGYIELFYDRFNNPGYRFFESLLYSSRYYNENSQGIALWATENDSRPFCLSTPRLTEKNILCVETPFANKAIDELARMRRTSNSYEYIKDLLKISGSNESLFKTFFTGEEPVKYAKYQGDKIRMRYFGHACILLETKDVSILIDPLISYYGTYLDIAHYSDLDLPDVIDYVIITHNHQDHVLLETLLAIRHKVRHIIVPQTSSGRLEDHSLKLMLNKIGFENVIALEEMECVRFEDTIITGLPFTGEHCDLNIQTKLCYHVNINNFKLLFLADSRIVVPELYRHIAKETGKVDVMFLGMECDGAPLSWLYGPLLSKKLAKEHDQSRRLAGSDCEKGMSLVEIFNPSETYVYAMGMEPWLEYISSVKYTDASNPIIQAKKFVQQCISRGITSELLFGEKEILYNKN